ncbi:hypothetical protein MKX01_029535, partial [Papaver californicum]
PTIQHNLRSVAELREQLIATPSSFICTKGIHVEKGFSKWIDLQQGNVMHYQDAVIPEAYERLILDTIRGDQHHFVCRDELTAAWEIFTPLLHRIDEGKMKPLPYKRQSRGSAEADELFEEDGYVQTHRYIWIPPTL